jgi:Rrf2 family cysteine metabolism transcriptional repressor
MMRISTRGRYALRAMVDVALHTGEGPVSRQDIATRQGISADYVAQLFRGLRNEGFVEAIKGPGGGYRLARDPATISAEDVLRVVEGPLTVVPCAAPDPNDGTGCHRVERCATQLLWNRLSAVVTEFLGSVTLQDLCDEAQRLEGTGETLNDARLE